MFYSFSQPEQLHAYGLRATKGATKAFQLVVQAYILKHLMFEGKMAKKGKDSDGLEPGGRRRVILLAAADGVKESRELTDHFCQSLKLWTVTQEMIVIGDAKMTNCCLGEIKV